jgi:tetratricopeptide (TPR) repeat protein
MWRWLLLLAVIANAQDKLAEAERLVAAGDYKAALAILESPSVAQGLRRHLLASRAYQGVKNPVRAVEEAEAALALDPANEAAHLQLGQIFLSYNTPEAAAEVFTEAERLFPESFLVRLGKGLALKELGRYEEATKDLRKCLEMQPASGTAFDGLGTALLHGSDFVELRRVSEEFIERNPADYRGYYYLGTAFERTGMPDRKVMEQLILSLARNPDFAATHALLGKVLLKQNSVVEAAKTLERAVALRPDHVQAHISLANAYRRLGRSEDASKEFRIVRELNEQERKGRPTLRYHRGER